MKIHIPHEHLNLFQAIHYQKRLLKVESISGMRRILIPIKLVGILPLSSLMLSFILQIQLQGKNHLEKKLTLINISKSAKLYALRLPQSFNAANNIRQVKNLQQVSQSGYSGSNLTVSFLDKSHVSLHIGKPRKHLLYETLLPGWLFPILKKF